MFCPSVRSFLLWLRLKSVDQKLIILVTYVKQKIQIGNSHTILHHLCSFGKAGGGVIP